MVRKFTKQSKHIQRANKFLLQIMTLLRKQDATWVFLSVISRVLFETKEKKLSEVGHKEAFF